MTRDTAYEFEFLKSEEETQALLKPCTIYFIIQRSLIYITNFRANDGVIEFEITDDNNTLPLLCSFEPSSNGFCQPEEEILIDVQFYKKEPDTTQPFCDVAAFKILNKNKKYLGWYSPQKFIYEYLAGNLSGEIKGDIKEYLDYTVHYIGKAFSQDIWDRLTGHEKMQSILTIENSLNKKQLKAPFEISLLLLDIDGFDESKLFPFIGFGVSDGVEPILHDFTFEDDDERFDKFNAPSLTPDAQELTSEVEALLVNTFKPKYNNILFDTYPNIKRGTRSAGYSESSLVIEKLPAILKTESHTQDVIFPLHT